MTEIALNPAANAALAAPANPTAAVVDLQMWASELTAAYSIGKALASTDFVPASLKTQSGGRPKEIEQVAENVAACILAGKALGLDPMNSIQNIFVVHGRPAMYARTMAALVMAAGHEIRRAEATEQRVVYRGRRKGETEWTEVEWTIARASKAGYLTNKKYSTDPIAMLTAKCQSEICRVIAPDVLTGIAATSVEEVELDDLGEVTTDTTPAEAPAPKARVQRARRQAPAPVAPAAVNEAPRDETPVDPEADELAEQADEATGELPAEPEAQPEEAACTPEQQKALGEALKAAGYGTKAVMMTKVTDMLGRGVESSKELTETEAIDLTARLWEEADAAQPDTEPAA
ncbi:RecT-like ssDNA binding protein [Arthrobacter phage Jinkies]|uniref:RecT-like ssDNA binding protein n=1 Tax=Arthrobacter phage Jinkies TaxID=2743903 RepID=A0A7S5WX36_9CAUD|nr:RecT-like ssDNA binding protein [Arthrobacter phage Jinkies]